VSFPQKEYLSLILVFFLHFLIFYAQEKPELFPSLPSSRRIESEFEGIGTSVHP